MTETLSLSGEWHFELDPTATKGFRTVQRTNRRH